MTKSTGKGRLPPSQKTHGHSFQNGKATAEYNAWSSMKRRCLKPSHPGFINYGGRGIGICERWVHSFENFLSDMGPKPDGYSLDRIDNNRGYEPENCRWATTPEQQRNRRHVRVVVFDGAKITLPDLAERFGIPLTRIRQRLDRGWPVERAVL